MFDVDLPDDDGIVWDKEQWYCSYLSTSYLSYTSSSRSVDGVPLAGAIISLVKRVDLGHVRFADCKVIDINVLPDTVRAGRLGQRREPVNTATLAKPTLTETYTGHTHAVMTTESESEESICCTVRETCKVKEHDGRWYE